MGTSFQNILLTYLKVSEIQNLKNVRKGGHQKMMKIYSRDLEDLGEGTNIYQKTRKGILVIWNQYLPTKVLTVNVGMGKKHTNDFFGGSKTIFNLGRVENTENTMVES